MSSTDAPGTDESRERVKRILGQNYPDRVFSVEDGIVWVSGMNSGCAGIARRMAKDLAYNHDIPTGLVYDDGAEAFGGVQFNYGEAA